MAEVSRRTVLYGASALAGTAALGGLWAAPPARAAARAEDTHRRIADDAALVWKRFPDSWRTGPFLANGRLGVLVYRGADARTVKFMLSHSQVQDQRDHWEAAIGLSRLPIGYLTLTLAGEVTAVDWRLDLWNAELSGTITTTRGALAFSALVHNDTGVLLVSLRPGAGEDGAAWGFTPLPSATTRTIRKPPDYVGNPAPTLGSAGEVRYAEQPLLAGGGYTTAWQERRIGSRRLLAATVSYSHPGATSTRDAVRAVRHAQAAPLDRLLATHREWWNTFYTRSLVSVPDKWVQRFYWIQLYKLAASTRADGPVLAEWGPWFPEIGNSWTAVWWNLNVQVAYPLGNGSNHPELDAVTATFRRDHRALELSVPPAYRDGQTYALSHPGDWTLRPGGTRSVGIPGTGSKTDQTGNLIWGLHNVWLAYRHSMDIRILRDVLYPILTKAVNFYRHFLTQGADGRLHLPLTRSPEYADAADCTYDLSLLRWGCTTLLETSRQLGVDDPLRPVWTDILNRLVPYHTDATGVIIGDGVPLADSHRHFSHLLWLYPLREKHWDNPADRDIMRRSYDHWASNRERWHGYSFAAASSMLSLMGSPDESLAQLRVFLDGTVVDNCQLTPNTMYREGNNFAIESPLAAAQSLLDMVTQSHAGVVSVFPAVPSAWREASIAGLRTEGAFLVDASRRGGATEWVRVHSEAGEPLVLRSGIADPEVRDDRGRELPWRPARGGIEIDLPRGRTAVVTRRGARPGFEPRDVPANGSAPSWGLPA
ncbi:glycosyl hydrolase family 95 catalytic domain-containing protein [Amycolatopsis suaedae]|uniref:Tat pathway signal sequence domain protein n=1 Tax=Amycolatopsis suaedae TaxID=2510978 RepID=A0A4Q7J1G1_9PSEU|nr:hypothetical protein [Amycolatopsis suaedae]RZQ60286.1 hypothetical protein EWH70_30345 [Amycolatopsis suaedae]